MSTIIYHKLVRDRIPEIITASGKKPVVSSLSQSDMSGALDAKLKEEVAEFLESHSIEEIADVLEVLRAIASNHGVSWETVEEVRLEKYRKRGGFERGIVLESVEEGESSGNDRSEERG